MSASPTEGAILHGKGALSPAFDRDIRQGQTSAFGGPVFAVPVADFKIHETLWLAEVLYRGLEIIAAAIGLILSSPLLLLQAVLIRLDSPGRALFFHQRPARSLIVRGSELKNRSDLRIPPPGLDPDVYYYVPRTFPLVKFRTMFNNARERFPELYKYSFPPEEFRKVRFKREEDPRVTRVGYYLRRLTIDELPNLWCVLIGEMRLVGPRPEDPQVLPYYSAEEMYKFSVKPGITGLAQINGRGLLNWGETLKWDLEYVRTRTVWLDIKILFRTLWLVLTRRGAF